MGRSIMRAVRVPFSPARPSRLKNEPGILPAAYMRSSTSTVSGRKSTSRRLPTVAVLSTMVSPWRTTTAPEACLAILPVSNEISVPAISTETVVTESLLICVAFPARPSVGGRICFFSESEPGHGSWQAEPRDERRVRRAGVQHVVVEQRGSRRRAGAQGVGHVGGDALGDRGGAAGGLEALEGEAPPTAGGPPRPGLHRA